ncbi:MBL fold metallo-hydrolase [Serratia sp. 3ACOL1]|uniref:MBL fold metallo-hydrolase n=1 Tax=Serratia sp. 3ACOL1 TaxID=2448483 RepID=UPI000EF44C35|nr:MBL fold metallo-hydrolase [Serratia sp. 3ACOL1]AYM91021.1 MBL fold metallo-hydrolase [Serratia sp. 3ACOL1]
MLLKIFIAVSCLLLGGCIILGQAKFGKHPEGELLSRIQASPNYKEGEFHNTVPTATLVEGQSSLKIIWKSIFADTTGLRPPGPLPTVKLDLVSLNPTKDTVIWLGHSSYFIQLAGKRILVDPIFSDHGAPFSFLNKTFLGTDLYTAADMPEIDVLVISHDHWDHLDYSTATALMPKVKVVLSPLGVGAHFERWGYPREKLHEIDWNAALRVGNELTVHVVPARHYSGRLFVRNKTLWAGFVLETPERRIFLSGDTGYGPHIAEIAHRFGGFDLVAIDGGQYDPRWPLIHMTPEEAVLAAQELKAETLLLAHVGRFSISTHSWDEPFVRAVKASKEKPFRLLTPKIGEPVWLDGTEQHFTHWWKEVK